LSIDVIIKQVKQYIFFESLLYHSASHSIAVLTTLSFLVFDI